MREREKETECERERWRKERKRERLTRKVRTLVVRGEWEERGQRASGQDSE